MREAKEKKNFFSDCVRVSSDWGTQKPFSIRER